MWVQITKQKKYLKAFFSFSTLTYMYSFRLMYPDKILIHNLPQRRDITRRGKLY